jgi:hypothetical protein
LLVEAAAVVACSGEMLATEVAEIVEVVAVALASSGIVRIAAVEQMSGTEAVAVPMMRIVEVERTFGIVVAVKSNKSEAERKWKIAEVVLTS